MKTIIKLNEEYYEAYTLSCTPLLTKNINDAYVFKTKHDAQYFYRNIIKDFYKVKPEFIEVK